MIVPRRPPGNGASNPGKGTGNPIRAASCPARIAQAGRGRYLAAMIAGRVGSPLLTFVLGALLVATAPATAQRVESPGPEVLKYLRVNTPRVILEHVTVIDGTGAGAVPDRNISIDGDTITAISTGADAPPNEGTTVLDLRGFSVLPGIVGMHDHLWYLARPNLAADGHFYPPGPALEMTFSAPRLYLANGVTTMRTAGSTAPYADVRLKDAIERGLLPGPHIDVTGPYLNGQGNPNLQFAALRDAEDARETVAFWADRGATSFKAYTQITRDELRAAIAEAHKRGLKVTGHLCSVTYEEAAEAGIDNIEHGFQANTALDPDKKPDACSASGGDSTLARMRPGGPEASRLIADLVRRHVAITSTLPLRAATVQRLAAPPDGRPAVRPAALDAMAPSVREAYLAWSNRPGSAEAAKRQDAMLRGDMALQRAFVDAG